MNIASEFLRRKPQQQQSAPTTLEDLRRIVDDAEQQQAQALGHVKAERDQAVREVNFLEGKLREESRMRTYYHSEFIELRTLVIATIEECERKAQRLREALDRAKINADHVRKHGSGQAVDLDAVQQRMSAAVAAVGDDVEKMGAKFGNGSEPQTAPAKGENQ